MDTEKIKSQRILVLAGIGYVLYIGLAVGIFLYNMFTGHWGLPYELTSAGVKWLRDLDIYLSIFSIVLLLITCYFHFRRDYRVSQIFSVFSLVTCIGSVLILVGLQCNLKF